MIGEFLSRSKPTSKLWATPASQRPSARPNYAGKPARCIRVAGRGFDADWFEANPPLDLVCTSSGMVGKRGFERRVWAAARAGSAGLRSSTSAKSLSTNSHSLHTNNYIYSTSQIPHELRSYYINSTKSSYITKSPSPTHLLLGPLDPDALPCC